MLKKLFGAKKVNVSPAPHSSIIFDNTDIETIVDYNLSLGSKKLVIKSDCENNHFVVKADELIKKTNVKVIDLKLLPIYKAEVNFVSPTYMREDFIKISNPFFGISLQNSNFIRPKLLASLEWICNRYSKCSVLIGDSIHRITLQAVKNLNEQEALNQALFLGKKFFDEEFQVFEQFKARCSFDFVFCSEIQECEDYKIYYDYLKSFFNSNKIFSDSIMSFAKNYHMKRYNTIPREEWKNLILNSCNYFLEEFAIFSCLKKRGKDAMIYPGSFSTLYEIAAGTHPDAPKELKELIVISLNIKKR